MDGVGMVYASKRKKRIRVAATTANKTESNHSLKADFCVGFFASLEFIKLFFV